MRPIHLLLRDNRFRLICCALAVGCGASVDSAIAQDACGDGFSTALHSSCCDRQGTLFRWSCNPCTEGGPDLSEPLVTDRPDFTEASSTVGRGVLQIESGYTYGFNEDGPDRTIVQTYPESLFRLGVWDDWLELRFAWTYAHVDVNGFELEGADDIYLGMKLGLTPQEGWLPEMAIIPQMTVPTGADVFTADEVLPGVNWLYGWDLSECLAMGGSTQFNRTLDGATGIAYTEWAQSWTFAYSLTERLGAYTEWFGLFPHSADSASPEHYFNGGFSLLLSNDVQWDIRGGIGLNGAAEDYFVGTGLSLRFH